MKVQNIYDWLLLFFVHEISEFGPYSEKLRLDIENCGLGENFDIWLVLDKIEKIPDSSKARFQLQVFHMKTAGGTAHLTPVNLPEIGITSPGKDAWKEAFTFILQRSLSKRKMLFTWSHGAGFGFNTGDQSGKEFLSASFLPGRHNRKDHLMQMTRNRFKYFTTEEINKFNATVKENNRFIPHQTESLIAPVTLMPGEYQAVEMPDEFDCEKLEVLWVSDFASVLRRGLTAGKIDFLIMMNCNMQLFENGFMLSDSVNVLVGPESMMWADGYAYAKLFGELGANPAISTEELSCHIVRDYIQMHKDLGHQDYLNHTTMFANSLSEFPAMTALFQQITSSLLDRLPELKSEITLILQKKIYPVSGDFSFFLLDAGCWIKTIAETPELRSLDPGIYEEFLKLMKTSVLASHVGKEFIESDQVDQRKYGYTGFSIFFPETNLFSIARKFSWCAYLSGQVSSTFQQKTSWDEFIRALFNPPFLTPLNNVY